MEIQSEPAVIFSCICGIVLLVYAIKQDIFVGRIGTITPGQYGNLFVDTRKICYNVLKFIFLDWGTNDITQNSLL